MRIFGGISGSADILKTSIKQKLTHIFTKPIPNDPPERAHYANTYIAEPPREATSLSPKWTKRRERY